MNKELEAGSIENVLPLLPPTELNLRNLNFDPALIGVA
jgi:hypothetical protein